MRLWSSHSVFWINSGRWYTDGCDIKEWRIEILQEFLNSFSHIEIPKWFFFVQKNTMCYLKVDHLISPFSDLILRELSIWENSKTFAINPCMHAYLFRISVCVPVNYCRNTTKDLFLSFEAYLCPCLSFVLQGKINGRFLDETA